MLMLYECLCDVRHIRARQSRIILDVSLISNFRESLFVTEFFGHMTCLYLFQLVYNLLDLCVVELFPELRNKEANETKS